MAKTKVMWNPRKQAVQILQNRIRFRQEKPRSRADRKGLFFSIATHKKAVGNLERVAKAMRKEGVTLKTMTNAQAQAWIYRLPERGVTDGTISSYKTALECCDNIEKIDAPPALVPKGEKATLPRATTPERAALIWNEQSENMRFVSQLVGNAGLRAKEPSTLRRLDRVPADDPAWRKMGRRKWDARRLEGREGIKYLTIGKNGLPRIVVIRHDLSERLEARLLDQPRVIQDRGAPVTQYYDLPSGQSWSQSFSDAAQRVLGPGQSPGGHALRHAFAHERMDHHLNSGLEFDDAEELVAQQLGHFRPESTDTYLR